MKKNYILPALLLLAFNCLTAQVTITTPNITVESNTAINPEIQVVGFTDIVGTQFTLCWDPTVLEYVSVNDFILPTSFGTAFHFSDHLAAEGKLTFAWSDESVQGVTLDDNMSLFNITFNVITTSNASTLLCLSDDPTIIEVSTSTEVLEVTLDLGTVDVILTSATETFTTDFTLYQNSPNPVRDMTYISFDLNNRTEAHLSIYDNIGRMIFQQHENLGSGTHTIFVDGDIFPAAGTYFYELKTDNAIARRKLMVH